jgi:hypothetical protein
VEDSHQFDIQMLPGKLQVVDRHVSNPCLGVTTLEHGLDKVGVTAMVLGTIDLVAKLGHGRYTGTLRNAAQNRRRMQQHVFKAHEQTGIVRVKEILPIPFIVQVYQGIPAYYLVGIKLYSHIEEIVGLSEIATKLLDIGQSWHQIGAMLLVAMPICSIRALALDNAPCVSNTTASSPRSCESYRDQLCVTIANAATLKRKTNTYHALHPMKGIADHDNGQHVRLHLALHARSHVFESSQCRDAMFAPRHLPRGI